MAPSLKPSTRADLFNQFTERALAGAAESRPQASSQRVYAEGVATNELRERLMAAAFGGV